MSLVQLFKASSLKKKIRPLTLMVRVQGSIEKEFMNYVGKIFRNSYFYFPQILTYDT